MGGEGVVLLNPAVHQLLHLAYLFACHPSRQIEVEAHPLSLHTSHAMSGLGSSQQQKRGGGGGLVGGGPD